MMQDRKALQAGTSHFLGQNFSKASGIRFLDEAGVLQHAWTTSWGVSTRLVGGLIMTHSDDDGLVLPPRLAPAHVVLLPILHDDSAKPKVMEYCRSLAAELKAETFADRKIEVVIDDRDVRGGEKTWQWVKKGIPVRVEVGPRDIDKGEVCMFRRDRAAKEKNFMPRAEFSQKIGSLLQEIQDGLLAAARQRQKEYSVEIDKKEDFYKYFEAPKVPENAPTPIHGGFAWAHFAGDKSVEGKIRDELGVTVRCIPLGDGGKPGTCPFTGKPSPRRVLWAKAY
jgi:prolyl-tRNA synthetase